VTGSRPALRADAEDGTAPFFSHSPPEVVEECLAHIGRILGPDEAGGAEQHDEGDERHGLTARLMQDWERSPHRQSKLRLRHA
jgi:hypothetical protein